MGIHKRSVGCLLFAVMFAVSVNQADAASFIVEDGKANAEIVVAEVSPRMTSLAALELQYFLKKISGAKVPIFFEKSDTDNIKIYVGKSKYTDEMGITDKGLDFGAFRMKSGSNYLVCLGHDTDYEPIVTIPKWDEEKEEFIKGELKQINRKQLKKWWGRNAESFNDFMEKRYGKENRPVWNPKNLEWRTKPYYEGLKSGYTPGFWAFDEGGSLNAVYTFLRSLGAEWYMPGELGELLPQHASVALPVVDKTVKPDCLYRNLRLGNPAGFSWDDFVWHFRLGLNNKGLGAPHGMRTVLYDTKQQKKHPEYYALYRNQRMNSTKMSGSHACYSHPGLKQMVIRYARMRYDLLNDKIVSISPEDGFKQCECELCKGKTQSELVWGYVDSVSRELYKSHPDRFVYCSAYGGYRRDPKSIKEFLPNVVVRISWTRPGLDDDARWEEYWSVVEGFQKRLAPKRLSRNANIQWSAKKGFPIIHPQSIAREFNALHGMILGEESSVPREPKTAWGNVGLSHLNVFVLSNYLWDNQQDLKALLDKYYTSFYGPAANEMRTAFEFAEKVYPRDARPFPSNVPYPDRLHFVELVHKARAAAGDTIYGKRVQLVIDDLRPVEELRKVTAMAEARGMVKYFPFMPDLGRNQKVAESFKLDGKLDEPFWTSYFHGARLDDNLTGGKRKKENRTDFYFKWYNKALYCGIRCDESDMDKLKVTTTENQDAAIHEGDSVTLLLETPDLSYYEITFNPAGAVWDSDHSEGGVGETWSSEAEVAVFKGDGFWSLEARIPTVSDQFDDPLHLMVGRKPTRGYPWYMNVIRKRPREDGDEILAWVPTKSQEIKNKLKFGKLFTMGSK